MNTKLILISLSLILLCSTGDAQVRLPRIFGNDMILQRDMSIPVWGTADPHSLVTVTFAGNTLSTHADAHKQWILHFPSLPAGGPYTMTIHGKTNGRLVSVIRYKNILIGDVWLASGQSNMELKVSQSMNAAEEIRTAKFADIRFFQVPQVIETEPQPDMASGAWKPCDSTSVGEFSAAAYFFARHVQADQHIPIGIIQATWGGTPVEAWTSKEMLLTIPAAGKIVLRNIAAGININSFIKDKENEKQFFSLVYNAREGLKSGITDTAFNDSQWNTIEMPGFFRDFDTAPYEGIIWLRKKIEIPESLAGTELRLSLGYPEMLYDVYVNDQKICENVWNAEKKHVYTVPARVVRKGTNIIAVRMAALWGGGGFNPPADSLYLAGGQQQLSLTGQWKYIKNIEAALPKVMFYHKYPSYMFNGMIHPIIPYGLKGVIWYQGEENAAAPQSYSTMFPLMMNDWRIRWQEGNLPFIYVQLPNYMKRKPQPSESDWALLREGQSQALVHPNTAMAVTIDIGEADNIHPKNKQEVGRRLALAALHTVYGKNILCSGPVYDSMQIEGRAIRIHFKNPGHGLCARDSAKPIGFAIAGADKKYYWADAVIDGETVVVSSEHVGAPIAVRYAWADNPACTLMNKEGLPAAPFRTDAW
jgi:sialate O-acetylesterase